ncbi:MAG: NAD(P)(+) transhydrogenase (Re/Si-specific) subunit beta [Gemmatimonadaceae bacterium]|nr:NAD(P)(+) transhydrogenase (Re/Si-specific) subunit beta [Gemmatimonadaceae bacterium]NUO93022.1 NAD(P)(+) transhydrogenase (Re/Si-specific) subunit beta [Gemmatimonadaceae bacterium]NUP56222.1 NAD(P)(+) transhydrogenase (Re/Si-specific) subunit beta [Gemmatimonadaceae bacterium]NUP70684.1 NAD(P)(+) transhydrogenase (Re/Si-specific) subunit beta [Gemmatimonadaceae bacterium]NUR34092.1 NAD(P)(+) transhydrogenase (Re/Si-specific) subunit beta [Gemmatimonadaceae bacterium]
MRDTITQLTYLAASVLFILGLRSLTRPDKARRGMQQAAVGMLLALCGTLMNHQIVDYRWIAGGLVLGALIGYPLGMWVPTTALPQRIAFSLSFGALAATLVGVAEYYSTFHGGEGTIGTAKMAALGFEVLLGSLTVTGALIAAGKLQEWVPSQPMTYRGQNLVNFVLFAGALALFGMVVVNPANGTAFYSMIGVAAVLGVLMVMPIGGADMPVVVALLNSYCGLAAAATGFALGNSILIICGALDGASGFLLSILMSKAMNRSFANVLFGAFGGETGAAVVGGGSALPVRSVSAEDAAIQLAYAQRVIIVPGYGMAVAQAQHAVRELAELIEKRGGEVKYAIHPVAGRMPGHMNVLLAEANVPYDRLYDMDEINSEFSQTDVALVIGANDVVNPAAREDRSSPIYGMPILDVDHAKSVIVLKRGMAAGFAGIENALFHAPATSMLFGDAKSSLTKLVSEVKNA